MSLDEETRQRIKDDIEAKLEQMAETLRKHADERLRAAREQNLLTPAKNYETLERE